MGKTRSGSHKLVQPSGKAAEPQGDQNHHFSESHWKDSATKMEGLAESPRQTDGAGEGATQWLSKSAVPMGLYSVRYMGKDWSFYPSANIFLFSTYPTNSVTL